MKISIITATYNSGCNIANCIKSVYEQSYDDIEHIIVDGASSDDTLAIINATPNRVAKIITEPDKGIYDAFNKGLSCATGEIISFLNSDDVFAHRDAVKNIIDILKSGEVQGVYGDLVYFDETNEVVRVWKSSEYTHQKIRTGWMPPHPTLVLRRSVYEQFGAFDPCFRISGDYDFVLRILNNQTTRLHYLPQVLVNMKIGGASNSSVKGLFRKHREDIMAIKKNGLRHPLFVLMCKNVTKLPQVFKWKSLRLFVRVNK